MVLQRCGGTACPTGGCNHDDEPMVQRQVVGPVYGPARPGVPPSVHEVVRSPGRQLPLTVRQLMEPCFGRDFSDVRVHTDAAAARTARAVGARAYTVGPNVVFGNGQFRPDDAAGRRLIAHELAHVIQQWAGGGPLMAFPHTVSSPSDAAEQEADRVADAVSTAPGSTSNDLTTPRITDDAAWQPPQLQRQVAPRQPTTDPLTARLTDVEWRAIDIWLSRGEVVAGPLTADPEHNADLVAGAIFCDRRMDSADWGRGDPLLCLVPEITAADPRVQALRRMVTARGPIIHWPAVAPEDRLSYVMSRLVNLYHYPVNGAAGIVGNLFTESGVLPSRIEGSAPATPMRSASFTGRSTDFDPDEVMNRSGRANPPVGPRKPGIGLAQWTSEPRRSNLFSRGSSILFDMDGQVDYLVRELQSRAGLNASLMSGGVSVNDASDNVVFDFEVPAAILGPTGTRLPRSDPAVQAVFGQRRPLAQRALAALRASNAAGRATSALRP